MSINPPMWSVATEWQIYFLFPLWLLPIWRRFGILKATIFAYIIGLIPVYLFDGLFEQSFYVGIFSLGMVAAEISFSQKPRCIAIKNLFPWVTLGIIFTVIGFIAEWRKLGLHIWVAYTFFGLAVACLFIYCTKFVVDDQEAPIILKLFQHKILVARLCLLL
jgi:peptidoglycan/LPS O-acetylase OafA/YrhL